MKLLTGFDWVFLDLETTGINNQTDKIIEIAAVSRTKDGRRDIFHHLVNPGIPIPPHITRLTGIDTEMVKEAHTFDTLREQLINFLDNKIIVAHNASFDVSFLQSALGFPLNNKSLDTIELAKILYYKLSSYSLQYLVRFFGQNNNPSHRALDDTLALEELFFRLINELNQMPLGALEDIAYCLGDEDKGLALFIQFVLRERVKDYSFAEKMAYPKEVKEKNNKETNINWDIKYIEGIFEPGGSLAMGIDEYQRRPEQIAMAKAVAKALSSDRHLIVEAGTGVGKTMAYLIPALYWALSNNEKVIVATHTIALQEQIIKSDIKFLEKHLGFPFKSSVLKGRNNYLCLQRWKSAKEKIEALNWSEKQLMARISHWLKSDTGGEKDSLSLRDWELDFFMQLASSKDTCFASKCSYNRECFYQKARQRAQQANLIIVNHSLLISDLKVGDAILPRYQYLIIDEAHHLEEEGIRQFSEVLSVKDIQKRIYLLVKKRDGLRQNGLLSFWKNKFTGLLGGNEHFAQEVLANIKNAKKTGEQVLNKIEEILLLAKDHVPESARIRTGTKSERWWTNLELVFNNLMVEVSELTAILNGIIRRIAVHIEMEDNEGNEESNLRDLRNLLAQLEDDYNLGRKFFNEESPESVHWLENETYRGELKLIVTPLGIGDYFDELLFSSRRSAVLTSATLSVKGGYDFLIGQLGLNPDLVDTLQIPSPFYYDEQAYLLVDTSLPDPAKISEESYSLALVEALNSLISATGGNTLVLFTSKRQMRYVFENLWEHLHNQGIELYADGINGNRHNLVNELKDNPQAVVFGTNTFWEGIDLPGRSLTAVIMVKLPFQPPTLPLFEAKIERLKSEGKDGFSQYSLPQAVLRFKQGYGRLIRTNSDCGVVVVLDNRVVNKHYGKTFIKSLPNESFFAGSTKEITQQIRNWFTKLKVKQ